MSKRILRLPDVIAATGLQKSEIYEKIREGIFPKQVRLGPKSVGWVSTEIESFVDDLIRQRDERDAKRQAFQDNGRAQK